VGYYPGFLIKARIIPSRRMRCVPALMGIGPGLCRIRYTDFREHLF
jgi:hypothetical protein